MWGPTDFTVTQLRASIRKVLGALDQAGSSLAASARAALLRDDDFATGGNPPCDWDDRRAFEALDGAVIAVEPPPLGAGQEVQEGDDGIFRILLGVAKVGHLDDWTPRPATVTSPQPGFDFYTAHLSIDPDSSSLTRWWPHRAAPP